jgi:CRP/FNR family transcriptional regulator, dissimilatory nitrate respiration regulator
MRAPITSQAFLAKLPLFKELTPEEIDRIAAGTRQVHAARGEVLFQKGDPCVGFHVVMFGQVKLAFTAPSGQEKVLELMGPGQSFGEAVMFADKPYVVYAQALCDTLLLHISKAVVFEELEREPLLARRIISGLSQRLHHMVIDLESFTLSSATQRLIGYLLRDVPENAGEESLAVALPSTKTVLASRLNITPQHFSRILHDLTVADLVRVEGRSIVILDAEGLRAYEP